MKVLGLVMVAALATDEQALIVAIVLARLLVPLLIPRFPLAILAALVLDAVDNSLLGAFTNVDLGPDGPYQSTDKALDIYYLAIAYVSTLRNWTNLAAIRVGQFLFYYRLVGVLAFELLESRAMLLLFPNTFEFFFIVYAVVALRYDPARISTRFWVLAAAGLWIFVKLPQEYWIHIAQLDFTDTVADHPWFGVASALFVLALLAVALFVVRPRLPRARPRLALRRRGARATRSARGGARVGRAGREGRAAVAAVGHLRHDPAVGPGVSASRSRSASS